MREAEEKMDCVQEKEERFAFVSRRKDDTQMCKEQKEEVTGLGNSNGSGWQDKSKEKNRQTRA